MGKKKRNLFPAVKLERLEQIDDLDTLLVEVRQLLRKENCPRLSLEIGDTIFYFYSKREQDAFLWGLELSLDFVTGEMIEVEGVTEAVFSKGKGADNKTVTYPRADREVIEPSSKFVTEDG